ncbi:hypothetical protein Hanom_Chr16g01496701 [Helianthus anomalus]
MPLATIASYEIDSSHITFTAHNPPRLLDLRPYVLDRRFTGPNPQILGHQVHIRLRPGRTLTHPESRHRCCEAHPRVQCRRSTELSHKVGLCSNIQILYKLKKVSQFNKLGFYLCVAFPHYSW